MNEDVTSSWNGLTNEFDCTRKESHYVFEGHIQYIDDFITEFLMALNFF